MDDAKQIYREGETGVKKTGREIDGHDVGDDLGNVGDEIRKNLGNVGDDLRREGDRAMDDVRRGTDEATREPKPTSTTPR